MTSKTFICSYRRQFSTVAERHVLHLLPLHLLSHITNPYHSKVQVRKLNIFQSSLQLGADI